MGYFYKVGSLRRIVFVAVLLCSSVILAAEKQKACLKLQQEQGWSSAKAVMVTVMSGTELNAVVGGYTKFQVSQTYAVLVGEDKQVTILTLSPHAMGQLPFFEQELKDQLGNKWRVKSGHWLCY
jgi:hypothetical protein